MKKGFTLIEILVVATIIGLLAGVGAVSFASISKSSRDARRKVDLENIRAAIEQYRSSNGSYPATLSLLTGDANGTVYMSKVPQDPIPSKYSYSYSATASDYTVGSYVEGSSSSTCSIPLSCSASSGDGAMQNRNLFIHPVYAQGAGIDGPAPPGNSISCNYCLGPYGPK